MDFHTLGGAVFLSFVFLSSSSGFSIAAADTDDIIFIHHSSGGHWLLNSLNDALLAKDYIDERNETHYDFVVPPDPGRPDSLNFPGEGLSVGDNTDLCHWVRWFNDYLESAKTYGCADGVNRIVMFKSCYPNSNIGPDDGGGGDPFNEVRKLNNCKAVFRHPAGPGSRYTLDGFQYKALDDVFAENPDTLFIYVTAPPLLPTSTSPENAARAREFNTWVKTEWLDGYNAAHPGLNNVAVFDWFDLLAVPEGGTNANTLRSEYSSGPGDNHPNDVANELSTGIFASDPGNFLDAAWNRFVKAPASGSEINIAVYPNPYRPGSGGRYDDPSSGNGIIFSGLAEGMEIRIFDVAGELVFDAQETDSDGRYLWNALDSRGKTAGSGVYLYLITSQSGRDKARGMFSIIR